MLDKLLRNLGIKSENRNIVIFILVCTVLLFLVSTYNKYKKNTFDFMSETSSKLKEAVPSVGGTPQGDMSSLLKENEALGGSEVPMGSETDTHGLPPADSVEVEKVDPSELLPHNVASEWSDSHQNPSNMLADVNLLPAGAHLGIDTVGQTLRNANLQLRSDPTIPKSSVGPWNNSTINETSGLGIREC